MQLVVPQVLQSRLFDSVHPGSLAAHLGAERVLQQLRDLSLVLILLKSRNFV